MWSCLPSCLPPHPPVATLDSPELGDLSRLFADRIFISLCSFEPSGWNHGKSWIDSVRLSASRILVLSEMQPIDHVGVKQGLANTGYVFMQSHRHRGPCAPYLHGSKSYTQLATECEPLPSHQTHPRAVIAKTPSSNDCDSHCHHKSPIPIITFHQKKTCPPCPSRPYPTARSRSLVPTAPNKPLPLLIFMHHAPFFFSGPSQSHNLQARLRAAWRPPRSQRPG